MMRAVLTFANDEVVKNGVIKTWVRQLRDASFDIEDTLQEFAAILAENPWCIIRILFYRHRVAKQMERLRTRVEDISKRRERYHLMNILGSMASQQGSQSGCRSFVATFSSRLTRIESVVTAFNEFQLIGRENEKHQVVNCISNEDINLRVISICGMGGVGKTSIIKDIYESQVLAATYNTRACVTIMRPFNCVEVLRNLVLQLDPNCSRDMDAGSIASKISTLLDGKKFFLVFDDLSSTAEWDDIIQNIPTAPESSCRIIVTTRLENIARYCSRKEEYIFRLRTLGTKDAAHLFTAKVFGRITDLDNQYPELVQESKLILKKCNGLPLAIVAIGGFLANEPKSITVWRKLNEHISSELKLNPKLGMIETVLEKSYDGLPYHLKPCFLYLSIFPEDYNINRKRLVRRWTAEGYSSELRDMSADEMSDTFFVELIDRSMILPLKGSLDITKGIDSCQVHDLMREISISKAMEENQVFRIDSHCISNTPGITRHLVINGNWDGDRHQFENTVDMSHIRSLTVFGQWKWYFLSNKMKYLRVLDFEGTSGLVDHHIQHIGQFKHLRYFSLKGCHGICHLPDSVGDLKQLETLDIRGTQILMLPKTMIKCQKLRHVDARGLFGYSYEQDYKEKCIDLQDIGTELLLSCCSPNIYGADEFNRRDAFTQAFFVKIPGTIMDLDTNGVKLPEGIRKLRNLETLRVVHLAWDSSVLHYLEHLKGLRKLGIVGINQKNGQQFCTCISNLSRLESLSIVTNRGASLNDSFADSFFPPESLKSLKIQGILFNLPMGIGSLHNIVKLKLRNTRLLDADGAMRLIGGLPKLCLLRLWWNAFQSEEVHFQSGYFNDLVMVEIAEKWGAKHITFEEGTMPKLNFLPIKFYSGMEEVGFSGIDLLQSLKEVCYTPLIAPNQFYPSEIDTNREENVGNLEGSLRKQLGRNLNKPNLKIE